MLNTPVKKLIIVTSDKLIVYAELLSSLISLKNDDLENNKIIGIKDGSVEAVVWTEKAYNDNKIQLSSNAKIVFVGKTKAAQPFMPSIRFNKSMEKYGAKIGWLGNKAIIYTEPNKLLSDKNLYDEFFSAYTKLADQFDDDIVETESIKKAKHAENLGETLGKSAQTVGIFFDGLFAKKDNAQTPDDHKDKEQKPEDDRVDFFNFGAKIEAGNLIPDQLFRFAVLDLYMNKLSHFLGMNDE